MLGFDALGRLALGQLTMPDRQRLFWWPIQRRLSFSGAASLFNLRQASAAGNFTYSGQSTLFRLNMSEAAGSYLLSGQSALFQISAPVIENWSTLEADSQDLPDGGITRGVAGGGVPDPYVPPPQEPRLVRKALIIDRLHAAGKLEAAYAVLQSAPLYDRQRWDTRESIYFDDPTLTAALNAVGADPAAILAPE